MRNIDYIAIGGMIGSGVGLTAIALYYRQKWVDAIVNPKCVPCPPCQPCFYPKPHPVLIQRPIVGEMWVTGVIQDEIYQ